MRTILVTLSLAAAFLLGSCQTPRTVDLETALRGTQRGEYVLVAVTDQFVSFQAAGRKDTYYFTAPLPPEVLTRIKAAIAVGSIPSRPIYFEDVRRPGN